MSQKNTPIEEAVKVCESTIEMYRHNGVFYKSNVLLEFKRELEKLIAIQKEQFIDFAQEYKSHCFQNDVPMSARSFFNEKYGTDGE